ncbi:hypothetical protein BC829DRAFT_405573 [Chytridium lagenaria]|nr:hypothetical protein BC829DRAFT_405573 [Chytridium lagenaria]
MKLAETKSGGTSLLEVMVVWFMKRDPGVLKWVDLMPSVEVASRVSFCELLGQVVKLRKELEAVKRILGEGHEFIGKAEVIVRDTEVCATRSAKEVKRFLEWLGGCCPKCALEVANWDVKGCSGEWVGEVDRNVEETFRVFYEFGILMEVCVFFLVSVVELI